MDPDECFRRMLSAARALLSAGYEAAEDDADTLIEQVSALAGWRGFKPKQMKGGPNAERALSTAGKTADRLADRDWSKGKHTAAVQLAHEVIALKKTA